MFPMRRNGDPDAGCPLGTCGGMASCGPETAVAHDATNAVFEKGENEELRWNFASLSKR